MSEVLNPLPKLAFLIVSEVPVALPFEEVAEPLKIVRTVNLPGKPSELLSRNIDCAMAAIAKADPFSWLKAVSEKADMLHALVWHARNDHRRLLIDGLSFAECEWLVRHFEPECNCENGWAQWMVMSPIRQAVHNVATWQDFQVTSSGRMRGYRDPSDAYMGKARRRQYSGAA